MRVDAIFVHRFPFEYWTPVINGTTVTYVKKRDDLGDLVALGQGGMTLMCKTQMSVGSVIRNLRDRNGTPLQEVDGVSYDLYINTVGPALDPFSNIVGWRHTLKTTAPRAFEDSLLALAAADAAG